MSSQPGSFRVGVVGLGLIGGSLLLALRAAGFASRCVAWDRDQPVLEEGLARKLIDEAAPSIEALMESVDIAVLATPTQAAPGLLEKMLAHASDVHCVTDVASVKGPLCALADSLPAAQAARYVPGHPIAGSERSGVHAANAELFIRHRIILTPATRTDDEARALATAMWEAAGGEVLSMAVADHDAVLAATSHLPHVLAYALVDALAASPICDDVFRFAAGGFRDFTRIASSDPVMWRDISLANRTALLEAIDHFSLHLKTLREAIARADGDAIEQVFGRAKAARDSFARDLEERGQARHYD